MDINLIKILSVNLIEEEANGLIKYLRGMLTDSDIEKLWTD